MDDASPPLGRLIKSATYSSMVALTREASIVAVAGDLLVAFVETLPHNTPLKDVLELATHDTLRDTIEHHPRLVLESSFLSEDVALAVVERARLILMSMANPESAHQTVH